MQYFSGYSKLLMQIYFILLLFHIDTNSIFYYIHLNFLHYPKFDSFCIILHIFPACPKKPNKTQKTHWVGLFFLKKTGFSEPCARSTTVLCCPTVHQCNKSN